jgi:hypothetical protein
MGSQISMAGTILDVVSINDIFEQPETPLVLCDTSIASSIENNSMEIIYEARRMLELDIRAIENIKRSSEFFNEFFSHERVHTISEVVEEKKELLRILSGGYEFLRSRSQPKRKRKSRGSKGYQASREEEQEKARIYKETVDTLWETTNHMQRAIIKNFDRGRLTLFEENCYTLDELMGARIDYRDEHKGFEKPEREDIHTDEKLVAMAFYMSMVEGVGTAIATCDSDILRLASYFTFAVTNQKVAQASAAAELLRQHPVRVYRLEGTEEAVLRVDTSRIDEMEHGLPFNKSYKMESLFISLDRLIIDSLKA